MKITASISGVDELNAQLSGLSQAVEPSAILDAQGAEEVERVQQSIRNVGLVDTGDYLRSWSHTVDGDTVHWGTGAVQALIQEFGGVIHARRGPYLHFQIDGRWIRTPSVVIPPSPHLRPATQGLGERLAKRVKRALERAL